MDTIIRAIEASIHTKQQILANPELVERIQVVAQVMIKAQIGRAHV